MEKHFILRSSGMILNGTATADEKSLVEAFYEGLSYEETGLSEENEHSIGQIFQRFQQIGNNFLPYSIG